MPAHQQEIATSTDRLLGGRVLYRQPVQGFRAAIDPVLLAASVPARPGDRVLEGGTGAGAAMLCLAARVPGLTVLAVDICPALCRLARDNARANGFPDIMVAAGDITHPPFTGPFDHAFANPPYHAWDGTPSPSRARETAKRASPELIPLWIAALARPLRHRGTLTLILPPWLLRTVLSAMEDAKTPAETVFPLWPKAGQPARLMVIRGRKNGRAPMTMAPGLTLHTHTGAYTPDADAVLRDGAVLPLP